MEHAWVRYVPANFMRCCEALVPKYDTVRKDKLEIFFGGGQILRLELEAAGRQEQT